MQHTIANEDCVGSARLGSIAEYQPAGIDAWYSCLRAQGSNSHIENILEHISYAHARRDGSKAKLTPERSECWVLSEDTRTKRRVEDIQRRYQNALTER